VQILAEKEVVVSTVDSLQISISVGELYFCGRALQSPIASASRDDSIGVWRRLLQSVFKVEWSGFSVKLPFFSRIWARDRTIFKGVFRI